MNKNNNISQEAKTEIINLLNTTLEQNYIEHNGKWYKENGGLAMEAPTTAILAEVFIQYLEHRAITDIFNIVPRWRYLLGLQTKPLNLSHFFYSPTTSSVLQSLCYNQFPH
jgi:hypothetical protein